MKCLTHNCENKTNEGEGSWLGSRWICLPCYDFLTKGEGSHNQIIANFKETNVTKINTFYQDNNVFTPYHHGGKYTVDLADFIHTILDMGVSLRLEKRDNEIFVIFYE